MDTALEIATAELRRVEGLLRAALALVEPAAVERVNRAHEALSLALMYYDRPAWREPDRDEWMRITGSPEVTATVLCDHIRKVLAVDEAERGAANNGASPP